MFSTLDDFLKEHSKKEQFSGGREYFLISGNDIRSASFRFDLSLREVEIAALSSELIPRRYIENIPVFGVEGQLDLLRSHVAVIGTGGSGGYVCELLARTGIGNLTLVDGDHFEETNLNRQLLCTEHDLGKRKAQAAQERIGIVNSAIDLRVVTDYATPETLPHLISEAAVLVDCVNTAATRIMLQDVCRNLNIPMVHGTIGGHIGRVMTILPGDKGVKAFYGECRQDGHRRLSDAGVEKRTTGATEGATAEVTMEAATEATAEQASGSLRSEGGDFGTPANLGMSKARRDDELTSFKMPPTDGVTHDEAMYYLSLGSPTPTPAAIAPWQVAEVVKIITGKGTILRNQVLVVDLMNARAGVIPLSTIGFGQRIRRLFSRVSRRRTF